VEQTEAREYAADIIANVLIGAYDAMGIDELEEWLSVDMGDAMTILFELGGAQIAVYWDSEDVDPFAEVQNGDPDPTFGEVDEIEFVCCPAMTGEYYCTRYQGHPGNHIAGDGDQVCAIWSEVE
jgi:hypothetical protein